MNFDVVVVGAGPGGSTAAKVCAENGLKVALIEKHKTAGHKVCAGSLEPRILKEFDVDESVVECYPHQVYVCSENRWLVRPEETSATVHREKFDRSLADAAVHAGSKFFGSAQCMKTLTENGKVGGVVVKLPTGTEKISSQLVIAADGYNSATARSAGIRTKYDTSDIALCVQHELTCRDRIVDDSYFAFYGNKVSPCGYGWIYPKKNGYTVGLGCLLSQLRCNPAENLHYLIYKHPIASKILSNTEKNTSKSNLKAACIPFKPLTQISGDGILVVGDAAGQVFTLVGAGIYTAMKAGQLAANVAVQAISSGDVSKTALSAYPEKWNASTGLEVAAQRRTFERIENYVNQYMDVQLFLERYRNVRNVLGKGFRLAKPILAM